MRAQAGPSPRPPETSSRLRRVHEASVYLPMGACRKRKTPSVVI